MRNLLISTATAAVLAIGSASAAIVPVSFSGTLGAAPTMVSPNATIDSAPVSGGEDFTISLSYDDVADAFVGAMIMFGSEEADNVQIIRADVFDYNGPSGAVFDSLDIDLIAEGEYGGQFDISFDFLNTTLDGSIGSALDALANDMGTLVCSHFLFNFGGFKFDGMLSDGGIVIDPVNPVPVPGAAVFMLSGLAAAGAAVSRRRRAA